jgi:hypothetical protein
MDRQTISVPPLWIVQLPQALTQAVSGQRLNQVPAQSATRLETELVVVAAGRIAPWRRSTGRAGVRVSAGSPRQKGTGHHG